MTRPDERLRAVNQTREFLEALRGNSEAPEGVRREAVLLLRHYPSSEDMAAVAACEAHLPAWDAPMFRSRD